MKCLLPAVCLLWLLFFHGTFLKAQAADPGSTFEQQILRRISALQARGREDFRDGMFPSYREYHHAKNNLKADDNIFFTGIIAFTLRRLMPDLDAGSKVIADSILLRAEPLYDHFKNTRGRTSYSFWQKDPPVIFPNGGWLNLFNRSQALPDDLDDTAILLLALEADTDAVMQAHRLMQQYTNNNKKSARGTLKRYRSNRAYSTWFGEKMPVELDVCVLTNALYLVHAYKLQYTAADSSTLQMISKIMERREYLEHAARISPQYARTPVIIYHIARLMSRFKIPPMETFRQQLIADALECYHRARSFPDRVMLSTSLMQLGYLLPDDEIEIKGSLQRYIEDNDFVFFIANISSILPRPLNQLAGSSGLWKFYYYCPAWNELLVLENIICRKRLMGG